LRLYDVCLGRAPDASGLGNWVTALQDGSQTGCGVAAGFLFSAEFSGRNYCNEHFVEYLYKALFNRNADPGGKANWLQKLASGSTREAVFNGFVGSQEFTDLCDSYHILRGNGIEEPEYGTVPTGPCSIDHKDDGVTAFVKRLYQVCFGREGDAAGLANWCRDLWNHKNSGASTAYGFIFSSEFQNKNYDNPTYVTYLYKAFFNRNPDPAGLATWTGVLDGGADRLEVFNGFTGSNEFTELCNSYGIVRG